MKEPRRIDLHMHTVVSDGTDTPAEILARVKEAGITLFSVTDHDAIDGCVRIRNMLREGDPTFIFGAEFSCEDEGGKYHILGYGYDADSPTIRTLAANCHDTRMSKVTQRLDFLRREYGFVFDEKDVATLLSQSNPGKPHVANLMIKYGYADTMKAAFDGYLNRFKPKEEHISPSVAIGAIVEAGGIPILAHPSYGSGDDLIIGKEMEERLLRLMACGVRGVEAFYSGFSRTMQTEMLTYAERYHLYVTAGSDYHGTNKLVRLGDTNMTDTTEYPDGLRRFLQDVTKY